MNSAINICVVGLGRAGNFHLHSIKLLNQFDLIYVVDTNEKLAQSVAEEYGCKWSVQLEDVLKDDALDAVVVASPTDAHFDYIRLALQAGKHVFTEKPVGHSVNEIQTCFKLAQENNKALHLGFQRRVDKNFVALKQRLAELGDYRIVKASSRPSPGTSNSICTSGPPLLLAPPH